MKEAEEDTNKWKAITKRDRSTEGLKNKVENYFPKYRTKAKKEKKDDKIHATRRSASEIQHSKSSEKMK